MSSLYGFQFAQLIIPYHRPLGIADYIKRACMKKAERLSKPLGYVLNCLSYSDTWIIRL